MKIDKAVWTGDRSHVGTDVQPRTMLWADGRTVLSLKKLRPEHSPSGSTVAMSMHRAGPSSSDAPRPTTSVARVFQEAASLSVVVDSPDHSPAKKMRLAADEPRSAFEAPGPSRRSSAHPTASTAAGDETPSPAGMPTTRDMATNTEVEVRPAAKTHDVQVQTSRRLHRASEFGMIDGIPFSDHDLHEHINCYQYAIEDLLSTGAPGDIRDDGDYLIQEQPFGAFVNELKQRLRSDDYKYIYDLSQCDNGRHVIAAFVNDENGISNDFHFARRDADGRWSEKFINEPPAIIPEGEVRNRNDGYVFIGYFIQNIREKNDDQVTRY